MHEGRLSSHFFLRTLQVQQPYRLRVAGYLMVSYAERLIAEERPVVLTDPGICSHAVVLVSFTGKPAFQSDDIEPNRLDERLH